MESGFGVGKSNAAKEQVDARRSFHQDIPRQKVDE